MFKFQNNNQKRSGQNPIQSTEEWRQIVGNKTVVVFFSLKTLRFHHLVKLTFQTKIWSKKKWKILDCVQPVFAPGHYFFTSPGFAEEAMETCGLYVVADQSEVIEVEIATTNAPCGSAKVGVILISWSALKANLKILERFLFQMTILKSIFRCHLHKSLF